MQFIFATEPNLLLSFYPILNPIVPSITSNNSSVFDHIYLKTLFFIIS